MVCNENPFTLCYTVEPSEEGWLFRDFLKSKRISSTTLTAIKYEGGLLRVNGVERTVRHRLRAQDQIEIVFPIERQNVQVEGEVTPLEIVAETSAYLVVMKPSNVATMPSGQHQSNTLAHRIAAYFERRHIPSAVHIVTRLDYGTSGLVTVAKNRHVHHLFSLQLTDQTFERKYRAIVEGELCVVPPYVIDRPIARKEGSIIERIVDKKGKKAVTIIEQIKVCRMKEKTYTIVDVALRTGRTHQIRVHLASLGFPIVGDTLYGQKEEGAPFMLHCKEVAFQDPFTTKEVKYTVDFPPSVNEWLQL